MIFGQTNVDDYIQSYDLIARYVGRDTTEVLGVAAQVEFITPDGNQSAIVLFNEKPFYLLFRFILYGVAFCIIVFQRLSIR